MSNTKLDAKNTPFSAYTESLEGDCDQHGRSRNDVRAKRTFALPKIDASPCRKYAI